MDALIWDRAADAPGPFADLVFKHLHSQRRRPSRRKLEQSLRPSIQTRLRELSQLWRDPGYRPYGPFGLAGKLDGRAGEQLVRQTINAAEHYFDLLEMWQNLAAAVLLLDREDSGNRWLFRDPV